MIISLICGVLFTTVCYATCDYYRLPRSVRPHHYTLRIMTHLDDASNLFFSGEVEIQLLAVHETNNITLHVGPRLNIVTRSTCLQQNECSKYIRIIRVDRNFNYDFYIMHLDKLLRPGCRYLLRMHFWARLERTMAGYYVSSYRNNDGKVNYMSVTQFEPADARSAFPCFDEPDLKATFNITLGHSCQFNALSNMPVIKQIPIGQRDDWVWSIFSRTKVMSTYLVAYSINDFQSYESPNKRGLKFSTWARASAIDQCKYATQIGPRLLKYYEHMFNIKYPLPKMDQLAVPDFNAGAMENWGLITFRESSLFYAVDESSQTDKQHVANTVAHELAHQWFGNLVTMQWWDDLWLNEGFATYMASLGVEMLHRKWHAYDEESLDNVLAVLNTDAFYSTRPIHQPVGKTSQMADLFDSITYRKGAVIIRMMHIFIGDKAFRNGINSYLIRHAYGNARQEDLWSALTETAHQCGSMPGDLSVKSVMDTWTLQKGIPLISVHRNYGKNTATITQQRYLLHNLPIPQLKSSDIFDIESCWFVPISYATEYPANFLTKEPQAWLRCSQHGDMLELELKDLPDGDGWLILNVQVGAPYRINYDNKNWEFIIKSLRSQEFERIHVMNRAQLVDDSLSLAWSEQLSYSLALELLGYLKQEQAYMPWRAVLDQLMVIERVTKQTREYKHFKCFVLNLLNPVYAHLDGMLEDTKNCHHVAHKALINKWACRLSQENCVKHANTYYQNWLKSSDPDQLNPVPTNLRSVVYCTALRSGSTNDWNFLWQRYRNTTVASEQRLILQALTCTENKSLLERYMKVTLEEKSPIRKQDASLVLGAIIRNDAGYYIARDYFLNKFELLKLFFSANRRELIGLLIQIAQHTSSISDYQQLRNFIDANKELRLSAQRSIGRAFEHAQMNLQWRQIQLPTFISIIVN